MYQLQASAAFDDWVQSLRDQNARARVLARLESAEHGNLGDVKSVGGGIREIRIHYGPGYRIYFAQRGKVLLHLALRRRQIDSVSRYRQGAPVARRFWQGVSHA